MRVLLVRADVQNEHCNQCLFAPNLSNGAHTLDTILKGFRLDGLVVAIAARFLGMDVCIAALFDINVRGRKSLYGSHCISREVVGHGKRYAKQGRVRDECAVECQFQRGQLQTLLSVSKTHCPRTGQDSSFRNNI